MNLDELLQWAGEISRLNDGPWGNSAIDWLVALAVAFLALLLLRIGVGCVNRHVKRVTTATTTGWDDGITETMQATKSWFLLLISIYAGSVVLDLPERGRAIMQTVAILALLLQAAVWGSKLLKFAIEHYMSQRRESDPALATTVSAMSFIGNLALWAVVLLLALDNMGVDVTTLVAGLGVGGIAVALAAQNILGDLFASLSIVLDKPFVLGDFIIVGDQMGTVQKVGLKTTRVQSLSGEQLVFANTDLLQSRIRNFKRMQERRVVFTIGVIYETPQSKLAEIPRIIRGIVESQENTRFDRSHFKEFGDFALNFESVYYVNVPDYNVYMDVQQAINLALFEQLATEGIEFAYPTQKLYVDRAAPDTPQGA
ncbi:MAG: mechanosensitive ion channel family protein [Planctomycetota bacterium]